MKYLDPERPLARRLRKDQTRTDPDSYRKSWHRAGHQIETAIKAGTLKRNGQCKQ